MEEKPASTSSPLTEREAAQGRRFWSHLQSRGAIGVLIFLLAFGVRVLSWHDTRLEVGKIQTAVVADYQHIAELFQQGGITSFFSSSSALADLNTLGHPPGYSILIAGIYSVFGHSVTALQFFQIAADSLAVVILFLIVAELLPLCAGIVAGLLAALSPQLAWNSVLLLPDSLSVLPILVAIYLLARAVKNPRTLSFLGSGTLIGLSCWLRANVMLLTFFAAAAALLILKDHRWRFAAAIISGTLIIVVPLTLRNAIVLHRFIPISLGAGQTFLEGIADYDKQGRFGIPDTDVGIMKQEADIYQRPDYYGTLFNPDGVERERARLARGFAVVRSHPFWFASVMVKRSGSMIRLERSRLISNEPAVTHSVEEPANAAATVISPEQMILNGVALPGAEIRDATGMVLPQKIDKVLLAGNSEKYGPQFLAPFVPVKSGIDYVVTVPVRMMAGRMRVSIMTSAGTTYSSHVIERPQGEQEPSRKMPSSELPELVNDATQDQVQLLKLAFVGIRDERVRVVWSNEASELPPQVVIGSIKLYELGPARYVWTRYARLIIHAIQKVFLTAVILPLAIAGLLILVCRRQLTALVILAVIPVYFFIVQSTVHTEYRYIISVTYFLFAFAGIAIGGAGNFIVQKTRRRREGSVTSA
jgi:hypothetical protein